MAMANIMVWAMLQLVLSEDTCKDGSCEDVSVLQVSSNQACTWRLSLLSGSCDGACGAGNPCDPARQRALQGVALEAVATGLGRSCANAGNVNAVGNDRAPYILSGNSDCRASNSQSSSACNLNGGSWRRICCCVPKPTTTTEAPATTGAASSTTTTEEGGGNNDPHIQSLKGAHYTLLKGGNFLAWSFSKGPVDWRLLASYSGSSSRFTPQSLLLLDHSGQTMEFTAEKCEWQAHSEEDEWRRVRAGSLLSTDGSNWDVQEVDKRTQDPLSMESMIFLNMDEAGGPRKVARLLVHCSPQEHLNFKVSMFEKNDMDHVGGELGAVPDANKSLHLSFLSAKLGSMVTKRDTEFEVPGTWLMLGGSEAAAAYLTSKTVDEGIGASFLSTGCSDVQEQEAEKICAKHLQKEGHHAEIFTDCVFDVCHGGGEQDAQSAAAFISA
ncbi:Autophagy-related protein 18a [Durusdinium trenchii]|uniref:Autophagy-related protein 18a n=1 Tax=Durusdinium trenchii TaxID=1381693 RepID=A0ABP0LQL3_9DINO